MQKLIPTRAFCNGDENGDEFINFLKQRLQSVFWDNSFFNKQLKPISSLVCFFEAVANFGNEFSF